jgi:hypothetical protein
MVWFFERESHTLRYEIRRQFEGTAFEIVISDSDGERLQQLESPTELLQHSERVWAGLIDSGWRPRTPRIFDAAPVQ